jgi:hypothetical protein
MLTLLAEAPAWVSTLPPGRRPGKKGKRPRVAFKLAINLVATTVLLLYTQTLHSLADVAAATTLSSRDLEGLRDPSPTLHAAAALLLLLAATTLAIYKPRGMTRYGQRKQHCKRPLLVP